MAGHIETGGDTVFAAVSVIFIILGAIGLGTVAAILGICSAIVSLIINWPKLRERLFTIFKNKKQ